MVMPAAFGAQSGINGSSAGSSGSGNSGTSLDGPPPHMAPRPAGADTKALMGNQDGSDIGMGAQAASPLVRAIAGVSSIMDGINQIIAVLGPGSISPQMQMEVQQLMSTVPAQAQQLQQQGSPQGMLQQAAGMGQGGGIGQSAQSGLPTMPSLGQSSGMSDSAPPMRG